MCYNVYKLLDCSWSYHSESASDKPMGQGAEAGYFIWGIESWSSHFFDLTFGFANILYMYIDNYLMAVF